MFSLVHIVDFDAKMMAGRISEWKLMLPCVVSKNTIRYEGVRTRQWKMLRGEWTCRDNRMRAQGTDGNVECLISDLKRIIQSSASRESQFESPKGSISSGEPAREAAVGATIDEQTGSSVDNQIPKDFFNLLWQAEPTDIAIAVTQVARDFGYAKV